MSVEISIYGGDAGQGGEAPEGNPLSVQKLMNLGESITVDQVGPDGMALVRIHPLDEEAVTIAFSNGTAETFEWVEYRILPLNSTLTMADVPSEPRNLTATAGANTATLAWEAPAVSVPPPIDYMVEYKLSASAVWQQFAEGSSTSLTALITGLTNGLAYDFRVRAVNSAGPGAPSNVASATPEENSGDLPAPPTAPSFTRNATFDRHLTSVAGTTDEQDTEVITSWYLDGAPLFQEGEINGNSYPGHTLNVGSYAQNAAGQSAVVFSAESVHVPGKGVTVVDDDFNAPAGTKVSAPGHADPDFGQWEVDPSQTVEASYLECDGAGCIWRNNAGGGGSTVTVTTFRKDIGNKAMRHEIVFNRIEGTASSSLNYIVALCSDPVANTNISFAVTIPIIGSTVLRSEAALRGITNGAYAAANVWAYFPILQQGDTIAFEIDSSGMLSAWHKKATDADFTQYTIGGFANGGARPGSGSINLSSDSVANGGTRPNALPAFSALGTYMHFGVPGSSATNGTRIFLDRISGWNIGPQPFDIRAVEDDAVYGLNNRAPQVAFPTKSEGREIAVKGTFLGSAPTTLDVAVKYSSDYVLERTTADSVTDEGGGVWKACIKSSDLHNLDPRKAYEVQVWRPGDTVPFKMLGYRPLAYPKIQESVAGYNKDVQTYFKPSDAFADVTEMCSSWEALDPATGKWSLIATADMVADPSKVCVMDSEGVIHNFANGVMTGSIRFVTPWYLGEGRWGPDNPFVVLAPNGWTVSTPATNANLVNVPGQPGKFYFTNPNPRESRYITLSGTIPAGGLNLRTQVKMVLDALKDDPNPVTAQELADKAGAGCARWMQGAGINLAPVHNVPGGLNAVHNGPRLDARGYGLADLIAYHNKTKMGFWYNVPSTATDAQITAALIQIRDTLDPTVRLYVEFGNELWNKLQGAFLPAYLRMVARGLERGFEALNATPNTNMGRTVLSGTSDVWPLPYRMDTLRAFGGAIDSNKVFPINLDLPEMASIATSSAFAGKTGIWLVQNTGLPVQDGYPLIPSELSPVRQAAQTDIGKWFPTDVTLKAWAPIPSGKNFQITYGAGYMFVTTTAAISPGTTMSTSNFVINDGGQGVGVIASDRLAQRYAVFRSAQVMNIVETVFGASRPNRVTRVLGSWYGGGADFNTDYIAWYGDPTKWDLIALGAYWGADSQGYRYLTPPTLRPKFSEWAMSQAEIDAGAVEFPGFTTTQKALFHSDTPAFVNAALYGGETDVMQGPLAMAMKSTVMKLVEQAVQIERKLIEKLPGVYVPGSIGVCAYECGMGTGIDMAGGDYGIAGDVTTTNPPHTGNPLQPEYYEKLVDSVESMLAQSEMADITYSYYHILDDHLGGLWNNFTDFGYILVEAGQIKRYSLSPTVDGAEQSPMFIGWRQYVDEVNA